MNETDSVCPMCGARFGTVPPEADLRSFGERVSDEIARFGGSWTFIGIFFLILVSWIVINSASFFYHFDPAPFILLNLILSCLAAVQAPIIMMSQNRQEARDRIQAQNDYRVNLKAEQEIRQLQHKIDLLIDSHLKELHEQQRSQMELLRTLEESVSKLGPRP